MQPWPKQQLRLPQCTHAYKMSSRYNVSVENNYSNKQKQQRINSVKENINCLHFAGNLKPAKNTHQTANNYFHSLGLREPCKRKRANGHHNIQNQSEQVAATAALQT